MAGAEAEELAVLEDAEQAAEFADLEDLAGLGIPEELLEMERKYRSMKHAARIVKVTTKYAKVILER